MEKYKQLQDYLVRQKQKGTTAINLTYAEIEQIIKSSLPKSAKKYRPWWANTHPVVYPKPWTKVGWVTSEVDMISGRVCFTYTPGLLRHIKNPARHCENDLSSTDITDRSAESCLKQEVLVSNNRQKAHNRHTAKTKDNSLIIAVDFDKFLFKRVYRIRPLVDSKGKIAIYYPQHQYNNIKKLPLHSYGMGPFCRFRISSNQDMFGVYAITIDSKVVYFGKCENLARRFNNGYGVIHPRNCHVGGQVTNCRINKKILEAFNGGSSVELYFHGTMFPESLEQKLIKEYAPQWNLKLD